MDAPTAHLPTTRRMLATVVLLLGAAQGWVWLLLSHVPPRPGLLMGQLTLTGALLAVIRLQKYDPSTALLLRRLRLDQTAITLLGGTASAVALALFNGYQQQLLTRWGYPPSPDYAEAEIRLHLVQAPQQIPLVLAAGSLLPALAEELLFRGFMFTSLRAHHGLRTALVGSAFFFALAHLDPWRFPALFLCGLFLGSLAATTGSVYSPWLAHAVNNLFACALINLQLRYGFSPCHVSTLLSVCVALTGASLAAGALWLLASRMPRYANP